MADGKWQNAGRKGEGVASDAEPGVLTDRERLGQSAANAGLEPKHPKLHPLLQRRRGAFSPGAPNTT
jgi:hypothetical protein